MKVEIAMMALVLSASAQAGKPNAGQIEVRVEALSTMVVPNDEATIHLNVGEERMTPELALAVAQPKAQRVLALLTKLDPVRW